MQARDKHIHSSTQWARSWQCPRPAAAAEVWREVFLSASFTPPAEECTGAFRSFCPNCCLVRSVGQDPEAAMQGGRKSKGWPHDRFSSGMSRARETALAALRRTVPFWEKDTDVRRPDRATPQPQHTRATTGTPSCCHHSPHNARAWRLACMCAVSDWCVCSRFKSSGCGVRPTGGLFPLRAFRRAPGRDVCI